MPPQPIDCVKRGASFTLRFSNLDSRSEAAKCVAECIAKWSVVELHAGYLFTSLLKINGKQGAEVFASLESASAKRHSLKAAALASMSEEENVLFNRLLSYLKSQQKTRDKLAHWIIGTSEEIDDALVLVDPKALWSLHGCNHEALKSIKGEEIATLGARKIVDMYMEPIDRKCVFVYTVKSLHKDISVFSEIPALIDAFSLFTTPPIGHGARKLLFDELARDARLQKG